MHSRSPVISAPEWLAIDLENWGPDRDTPLTKAEYNQWLTVFLAEVQSATGITCMVYTYKSYLDLHLPPMHQFGSYPLWIANYNNPPTPPLPVGWTKYFMWQYSDSGTMAGITGHVDMSRPG
jgi:lysozyme